MAKMVTANYSSQSFLYSNTLRLPYLKISVLILPRTVSHHPSPQAETKLNRSMLRHAMPDLLILSPCGMSSPFPVQAAGHDKA